ncbi:MAG: 1-deoxy-D-xylulose-5-phosphate synthase [Clostridia bacterium]|nr:1-deoxy-D-xylulose-5-phosphate synthase [Clostridia bacterium]
MEYPILSKIKSPKDIKKLNIGDTAILCEEIRNCIMDTVSKNGGHLASNLGSVELTVALHRAFSSPDDAIIFDVGHQCYAHKLLTGRFTVFDTLRTEDGISGFMKPSESVHDPFITGHSSNSISAAYGIYKAKKLSGEAGTAVAVIGDGAMTGGMAYEALNNAGGGKGNFIVVLNDNKMSISKNVGSLAFALAKMRNRTKYHNFKFALSNFLLKIPFIGKALYRFVYLFKEILKGIVYRKNVFSSLGFNYLGPVDGHNIKDMESLFKIAQSYNKPSLVHVITKKGKGYYFAEKSPKNYHGVSSFNINEGANASKNINFSTVAGDTLTALADSDSKICAITAAMTEGTGLKDFAKKHSDRFFDVGIAEQHAVTFGAGLASRGMKPYFLVYSTFLQRGFDQIIHDMAIGDFNLRLLVDRAGVVGEDGETHQGIFDVSYLTLIPKMNVYSPSSYEELKYRINKSAENDELCAIRYPRGSENTCLEFDIENDFSVIGNIRKKAIITYGRLFSEASKAFAENPDFTIIKLNKIYPISENSVDISMNFDEIHFFEESIKSGSIAEHFATKLVEKGFKGKFIIHAIDGNFVAAASVESSLSKLKLDSSSMLEAISNKE